MARHAKLARKGNAAQHRHIRAVPVDVLECRLMARTGLGGRCTGRRIIVVERTCSRPVSKAANDAVDRATLPHRECYSGYLEAIAIQGGETAAGEVTELARTGRRNADKVVLAIGRTRVGHRTFDEVHFGRGVLTKRPNGTANVSMII